MDNETEARNPLAFLSESEPQPVQVPQPAEPVQAEAPEGPVRGADGRFAPKDVPAETPAAAPAPTPDVPATPEPAAEVAADPATPPGYVPLGVVQELRREIAALKTPAPTPQRRPDLPTVAEPDADLDPEAHKVFQTLSEAQWVERRDWSARLAEAKHGKDLVSQAHAWGYEQQADPVFLQRLKVSRDPYEFMVGEYRRSRALDVLSRIDDPSKLDALLASFVQPNPDAAAQAAPPQRASPAPIPKTIATAPGNGIAGAGAVPVGPGQAYDALFSKG